MGRRGDRQTGFSTVEVLIVVAVVAVIGLAGALVYFKHSTKGSNVAATNQPSNTNQRKQTTNTQTQQTATNYITIAQWGVRASYSGTLNLTYTMSSDNKTAQFSSNQLTAVDSNCVGRGGFIQRYAPTDIANVYQQGPTVEQEAAQNPGMFTHVGNYYYLFQHDQAACDDPTVTGQLYAQTNDAVKALVPNLQAVPAN